jgi:hypothetical protein
MLSRNPSIRSLNPVHWKRLLDLGLEHEGNARRVVLVHRQGQPVALLDSLKGVLPLPAQKVEDPQALAESLLAENPQAQEAWVVEPSALRERLSALQAEHHAEPSLDGFLAKIWQGRFEGPGMACAPKRGFLWYGLPMERFGQLAQDLLPKECAFVLAVYDDQQLWASLLVEFKDAQVQGIATFDALPQEELGQALGHAQLPFLLSLSATALKRPCFGWSVPRADFEAWMRAATLEAKNEAFQASVAEKRSVFDLQALLPGMRDAG